MLLPVYVYLIPLYDLIDVPLSLFLHFYFAVWCIRCPCPCLPIGIVLHCLYGCLSCPTRIICGCPLFISLSSVFCFLVFPPESLPGDDVLCRLLSRPLPFVCFLLCLFVLFCFSPTVFVPGLFWCKFLYFVTIAGFVADQLIM